MTKSQALYWYYRRCGFDKCRAFIMALPLWVSMIIIPAGTMALFMLMLKFV